MAEIDPASYDFYAAIISAHILAIFGVSVFLLPSSSFFLVIFTGFIAYFTYIWFELYGHLFRRRKRGLRTTRKRMVISPNSLTDRVRSQLGRDGGRSPVALTDRVREKLARIHRQTCPGNTFVPEKTAFSTSEKNRTMSTHTAVTTHGLSPKTSDFKGTVVASVTIDARREREQKKFQQIVSELRQSATTLSVRTQKTQDSVDSQSIAMTSPMSTSVHGSDSDDSKRKNKNKSNFGRDPEKFSDCDGTSPLISDKEKSSGSPSNVHVKMVVTAQRKMD